MSESIGARINYMIQAIGITQKELASRAGITEAAISRYISGERVPRALALAGIAKALGTTMEELMGEPSPQKEKRTDFELAARHALKLSSAEKAKLIEALAGSLGGA